MSTSIPGVRTDGSEPNWSTSGMRVTLSYLCIGECLSSSPFLKNNGAEGPRPIPAKAFFIFYLFTFLIFRNPN
jgi:hypothetical protein